MTESAITTVKRKAQSTPFSGRDSRVKEWDACSSSQLSPALDKPTRKAQRSSKLSVLVAAYNEEATLWPCVKSVLAARLPRGVEREIIVVDDGSTDGTWEIAQ